LASALAFGTAEVPTLLLSSKLLRQSMGTAQDWSFRTLGKEALGLGFSMALLKGFGIASHSGVGWIGSRASLGVRTQALLPAMGGIAGLYAVNRIEQRVGLREESSMAASLIESIAFFTQGVVGGHWSQEWMGPRWSQRLQELELRSELARSRQRAA